MIGRKVEMAMANGMSAPAPARRKKRRAAGVGRMLAPALQAGVGAMAFVFLFAAVVPAAWLNALAWQLYLDQLSAATTPPLGMTARVGFAVVLAVFAGLIAFMVMLAVTKPPAAGSAAMTRRVAARARKLADVEDAVPSVRRADAHPDAPPRAPFRADRDLTQPGADAAQHRPAWMDELAADAAAQDAPPGDTLDLSEFASAEAPGADQHADLPAADDQSLGALVARFEAGLARRRMAAAAALQTAAMGTLLASNDPGEPLELGAAEMIDGHEPTVDLGLEAALSTLQRMSRRAVG